ncbi:hypothetical protein [Wenyingzhuangia sp. IMCC45574]
MTETSISLLSILFGVFGAIVFGKRKANYSFGISGNAVIGVFGSVLLIKSFGRLGFAPNYIVSANTVNYFLLALNLIISLIGGIGLLTLLRYLYNNTQSSQ